jgi:hypothetical protein
MAREKSSAGSANAHPAKLTRGGRRCEVCGVSSNEKTLVGLRNDRRRNGPRFCLAHHPDSMAGSVRFVSLAGSAAGLSVLT